MKHDHARAREELAQIWLENECSKFKEEPDKFVKLFVKVAFLAGWDAGVESVPFTKQWDGELFDRVMNSEGEKSIVMNGVCYIAEDVVREDWEALVKDVSAFIAEATTVLKNGRNVTSTLTDELIARIKAKTAALDSGDPQVIPINSRKEKSNLRPIKSGPLEDPDVVGALLRATDAGENTEAEPDREDDVAEIKRLRLSTGDSRFDPTMPITVNGYPFVPLQVT